MRGYTVLDLIGEGAAGRVYRALQHGSSDRTVALKRLAPSADATAVERMRREGQVLAALDHPHIVRIHELVADGDGVAIAMQFAPGGSLADRLRTSGPLTPSELVAAITPVADALHSAHGNGVLHRDVKPSNILFTSDGEPLLSDFGVARWRDAPGLTAAGMSVGTAGYIDPDVADGGAPSARSDVYSLGVVCYEALVGGRPFRGTNALALLRAADKGEFIPLTEAAPAMPWALAAVIEQAMARRPDARFATAAAFAEALRATSGTIPPPALPLAVPPSPERPQLAPLGEGSFGTRAFGPRPPLPPAPRRRRPSISRAAAAFTLAVLLGGTVLLPRSAGPVGAEAAPPAATRVRATVSGNVVELDAPGAPPRRFALGEPGDVIVLGDWDCDGTRTAALYRPRSGEIFLFSRWAGTAEALTSAPAVDTGVRDGRARVRSVDGCDELSIVA